VDKRKGVICYIAKPEEMPVDSEGNRADIVMDGLSTVNRMNVSRLYEQYINAASRDVSKRVRRMLGVQEGDYKGALERIVQMETQQPDELNRIWDYLMGYYECVSARMHSLIMARPDKLARRRGHLASIVEKGIYIYYPTDNENEYSDIIRHCESRGYAPVYGPVTYVDEYGVPGVTETPVRIGSVYMMLLEKIGDDAAAVSSGKYQHFGVLSQVTNTDKYSMPCRNNAVRALGEAEIRLYTSYVGPEVTAELLDRNNSPFTHRHLLHNLMSAVMPSNVESLVNRKEIPLGGSRPLQLVKHLLSTSGIKFVYKNVK
jgi:hypothetical protein